MAEWTGQKRTLNSIAPVGKPPVDAASDHVPPSPVAPGAEHSPQRPGETPDTPDLIGRPRGSMQPLASVRRPLTEYGTAQSVLGMYAFAAGAEVKPEDWEQGPSAFEEQRKADPAYLTPPRPLAGYGLGLGRSAPVLAVEVLEAIEETPAVATPASQGIVASVAPAADGTATAPAGAVVGNGTNECPPGFPIKGNQQSMLYHDEKSRSYGRTIAEFCFSTPEAAQAAGFRAARDA